MNSSLRQQVFLAAVTSLVTGAIGRAVTDWETALLPAALAFCLVLAAVHALERSGASKRLTHRFRALEPGRRTGALFVSAATLAIAAAAVWDQVLGPLQAEHSLDESDVAKLLATHRWITYNPRDFDPGLGVAPSRASIRRDLVHIRRAGFDGVITFTSLDEARDVPEIAHALGQAVIMGVWNPGDRREVANALSRRSLVAGYAVGHNGLDTLYTLAELRHAMRTLRFRSGRPVATTEKADRYLAQEPVAALGDWIFPDVHVSLLERQEPGDTTFRADAVRDARRTITLAGRLAALPGARGKPMLLKMVGYPVAGIAGASPEQQAVFFRSLLFGRRNSVADLRPGIFVSIHSAFDMGWKSLPPYYPWDAHTGVLDSIGRPRAGARAAREWLR